MRSAPSYRLPLLALPACEPQTGGAAPSVEGLGRITLALSPLFLPLGRYRTLLFAIDAGLGPLFDTELSLPLNQIRLKPGLEVPQHLLYFFAVHVPFLRRLLIGRSLWLPAKRHPPATKTATTHDPP
jgi:hypothetical protein